MRASKQQWLKKIGELEELVDAAEFKVGDGEVELTKLLKDMKGNLAELVATPGSDSSEGGQLPLKVRLNSFMAEMQSWIYSALKKQDFVFEFIVVVGSSRIELATVLQSLNFSVRHKHKCVSQSVRHKHKCVSQSLC